MLRLDSHTSAYSLRHSWQWISSHVSCADVNFICHSTDKFSLDLLIKHKRIRFLNSLRYSLPWPAYGMILHTLYMYNGRQELSYLEAGSCLWYLSFCFLPLYLCFIVLYCVLCFHRTGVLSLLVFLFSSVACLFLSVNCYHYWWNKVDILQIASGISKSKGYSLWNFVSNCELSKSTSTFARIVNSRPTIISSLSQRLLNRNLGLSTSFSLAAA